MNKLVKSVSKADLNTEFLKSLNGILDLTDRELELLATFIAIDINTPKLPNISKNVPLVRGEGRAEGTPNAVFSPESSMY